MKKQIQIRIFADGRIEAETLGIKGKSCIDFISLLEELLDAETINSDYKTEYYETEETLSITENELLRERN